MNTQDVLLTLSHVSVSTVESHFVLPSDCKSHKNITIVAVSTSISTRDLELKGNVMVIQGCIKTSRGSREPEAENGL